MNMQGWVTGILMMVSAGLWAVEFDFESGDLQGWRVIDGSFEKIVTDRAMFHHPGNIPYNKQGKYFISTLESKKNESKDAMTGVVQSPPFKMTGSEIRFWIGGGSSESTAFGLYSIDGKLLKSAYGENKEMMRQVIWQVPECLDSVCFLRITDENTGGWGHLAVDSIVIQGDIVSPTPEYWTRSVPYKTLNCMTVKSVRAAILDLQKTFGSRYPNASEYLKQLDSLEKNPDHKALDALAEKALKMNPLLVEHPLLMVLRPQYRMDHHNTATMFQTKEINWKSYVPGGALKVLDVKTGNAVELLNPGENGAVRDPDVDFDAGKILFSMRRNHEDNYHIYEMDADGTNLCQLTALPNVSDIDPLYLPDGDIVFSSTRQPKYCMCNRHIMANLCRMNRDGANPHPIGRSTLFEGHSALLSDGRILYDRWEYVDRNFGDAQGLWTVNPDGSNHAVYWGNNTASPGGMIDARPIPGTQKVIATFTSCHDRPWGGLGIIDRQKGLDGVEPVETVWPADYKKYISASGQTLFDTPLHKIKLKFEDPYPLNDRYFLASRQLDPAKTGEKTGLFLLDVFGNEVLIYADSSNMGVYDAMPIAPRQKPPVRPSSLDLNKKNGIFFVQNVYEGTHMKGVSPGEIKYLRIVESPEKRTYSRNGWSAEGEQAAAVNWRSLETKQILGIVPVESDGSACFEVPADKFVFFQALDSQYRMVQTMRSGTMIRPGEYQSCVGCHEDRLCSPPANMGQALAARRGPSPMTGWRGKTEMFSYQKTVQPIWDEHCISCHDFGKKGGKVLNLCGDISMPFNVSYTELNSKKFLKTIGAGPSELQQAKSWGARCSTLYQTLISGHHGIELSPDELETIVTWIDLNALYYPFYETAYPDGVFGRGPLTPAEYRKLQSLTPLKLVHSTGFRGDAVISLTRPDSSLIFTGKEPEKEKAALALLKLGQARLMECPRADMPGFKPRGGDAAQLRKYEVYKTIEDSVRRAMLENRKLYDRDFIKIFKGE